MINEALRQAIEGWQQEDKEKRAILVIAIEEKERTEEETHCETAVAVMGGSKHLVEAVKAAKRDGGVVAQIFNKEDFSLLMDKLCK